MKCVLTPLMCALLFISRYIALHNIFLVLEVYCTKNFPRFACIPCEAIFLLPVDSVVPPAVSIALLIKLLAAYFYILFSVLLAAA